MWTWRPAAVGGITPSDRKGNGDIPCPSGSSDREEPLERWDVKRHGPSLTVFSFLPFLRAFSLQRGERCTSCWGLGAQRRGLGERCTGSVSTAQSRPAAGEGPGRGRGVWGVAHHIHFAQRFSSPEPCTKTPEVDASLMSPVPTRRFLGQERGSGPWWGLSQGREGEKGRGSKRLWGHNGGLFRAGCPRLPALIEEWSQR